MYVHSLPYVLVANEKPRRGTVYNCTGVASETTSIKKEDANTILMAKDNYSPLSSGRINTPVASVSK